MAKRKLPLRAVAALFLERQHLSRPRTVSLSPLRLRRFVEDAGGLQLDSINVVERAHYLTVWSRFGVYDRAELDRLVHVRRLLFEYWAHAACLVPTSALGWWRRAMLDYRVRHTGWSDWLRRNPKVLGRIQAAILASGPLAHADFETRRPKGEASGWWSWKPSQHALHYLWMTGVLTVESRRNFHKRFDLFERVIPAVRELEPPSTEAFARWHVERSLHAMGAATETDMARYLTFPRFAPGIRRAALRCLVESGEVVELEVETSLAQPHGRTQASFDVAPALASLRETVKPSPSPSARWFALRRDLRALERAADPARVSRGTTLLAPFDSLLWHRDRVSRLFGFDYRIEVYTPAAKRIHGYYSLPILHDGELVGRLDAKAHRAEKHLEVRHVHFEPWFVAGEPAPVSRVRLGREQALAGLEEALDSLAAFVAANRVSGVPRCLPSRRARTGERRSSG